LNTSAGRSELGKPVQMPAKDTETNHDDRRKNRDCQEISRCSDGKGLPAIRALLTDDAKWVLPGDNLISGKAIGADDVTARAQKIAGFGLTFALERILVSPDNFALSLHNTATRQGRVLDEHLATVCFLRDGKIAAIETYLQTLTG
jgi:ketosteroid isomerase-like protein